MGTYSSSRFHRVLVADDDPALRSYLREWFSREEIAADVCPDGATALEAFSQGGHTLLILDMVMPGRTGIEILSNLRSCGVKVPVILMSGSGPQIASHLRQELEPVEMLFKPFGGFELREAISRAGQSLQGVAR